MGRIVLSGYYGFDNTGDEAVMYSIIKTLKEEIEDIHITVLSNNPKKTASTYDVEAVNRWKYNDIISALKKADILISGGGSLLQDITSWKSIFYYLSIVIIAKLLGKKVVFYAQGIGPIYKKINKILVRLIVNKVDYISVRDKQSKQELIDMGIKKSIDVVADPVLKLNVNVSKRVTNYDKKRLGVYLREWEKEDKFLEKIKDILKWFSKQDWEIIFIPMHYPDDIKISKEICKEINNATVFEGDYFPENILKITSTMDYVISMRLHGLIMAGAVGVPFLGLSYDPKVKNFVDTMGTGKSIDIYNINVEDTISYLTWVINNLDELKEEIEVNRNKLLELQDKPIRFIKQLINRGEDNYK
ncbi:polysaccharide pyruvyl transferase CsaB [Defluviitalea phaphyphila]|uniref:polysaccharide pyruvyl transferase CsaB n=1 Tax=Defluviitalea phaphyphila TaxID=1473580 RepID=UPI000731814F|nr:polysaccharide pyruvyl transferase CsaB [Defluviitalea phaphyphila]